MVTIRYADGKGWYDARVEARAPIPMDPATAVLHYAQEIFEGLKAYRTRGRRDHHVPAGRQRAPVPRLGRADGDGAAARRAVPRLARTSWSRSTGSGSRPTRGRQPLPAPVHVRLARCSSACKPVRGVPVRGDRLAGRLVLQGRREAGRRCGSRQDYTRAAPGGTGAAKCGGNYAASLVAQAEAIEHGCDQVVFLDAVERRYVDELGGMNIFFVLRRRHAGHAAAAPARSCPASPATR